VAKHIELEGLALGFHRFVWLALGLGLIMAVRGQRLSLIGFRLSWLPGLLFAANIAMFFTAIKLTTVANATVIGAIQPAMSMVLVGRIFGERVHRSDIWLTGCSIAGVVLVVYGSSSKPEWDFRGDLLSIGSILAWTWYLFVTKRARQEIGAIELQTTLTIVAAVVMLPIALLSGQSMSVPGSSIWFLALLAIVGGIGHTLVNFAHGHTKLLLVSLMFLGIPVLATSWAAIFLGESVNRRQVTGMAIVLAGLGVLIITNERRDRAGKRELALDSPRR
jgi:drug/metabolite transporter (DMT)-like permease